MHLLAVLEYDGTDFAGFQIQAHARSVQGEFEAALERVTGAAVRVVGGGRTDAGVHALGQTASFTTEWNKSLAVLQRALNAVLPTDVGVRELLEVPAGWSARHEARSRTYRYTILNRTVPSPLQARYSLHVPYALDARRMQAGAALLTGEKDFRSFGSPPKGENTVRRLLRAGVTAQADVIWVDLEATAFLYRMVRRIVGTLLLVGRRHLEPEDVKAVLAGARRAGPAVPPHGLCLLQITYDLAFSLENERRV